MFRDSLGNAYEALPKAPPVHTAKGTTETSLRRSSRRKSGRKVDSHARYRNRVGKPRGRGEAGNKSGSNR